MAKRCFTGCKNINPGIVKIPVDIKSDYGQAALANAITLTPGTITMEMANGAYQLDPEPHYRANIETLRSHFDGGELV